MKLKAIFFTSLLFAVFLVVPVYAHGGLNIGGKEDGDVEDLQDEIEELEEKIADLQGQEKSLLNEIAYFDSQVSLTQLRIQNAEAEIIRRTNLLKELQEDIETLADRILKLADSIDYQRKVLSERMRERYKSGVNSPVIILFGSNTLNTLVKKTEYLKVLQAQDQELLDEMEKTKSAFTQQKDLFEDKKEETEVLKQKLEDEKANLEVYRRNLDEQRATKQAILERTQNDEAKYQEELSKARAELNAIQAIIASIDFKNGEEVEKGDVIAVMGNTGYPDCSTGAHLHFEVRKDGALQNPEKYLKSKSMYVYDFNSGTKNLGSGDWSWPMKGSIIMNQRYGETPWSWRYPSKRHDGLDMEASDKFIYAPEDGKLVKGQMGCYNSVIKFAAIEHDNDVVSYYLHIK